NFPSWRSPVMGMYTLEETRMANSAFVDKITSNDPVLEKQALDSVNDFTRYKMREDGFSGKILPEQPIQNEDLDRSVETDENIKIIDMEPDSPAAISVPYGSTPMNLYIQGN